MNDHVKDLMKQTAGGVGGDEIDPSEFKQFKMKMTISDNYIWDKTKEIRSVRTFTGERRFMPREN